MIIGHACNIALFLQHQPTSAAEEGTQDISLQALKTMLASV